jgi:hypothetical protein
VAAEAPGPEREQGRARGEREENVPRESRHVILLPPGSARVN